jgi:GTP:adenosylcobinamide-phosphate guanylyltransferase
MTTPGPQRRTDAVVLAGGRSDPALTGGNTPKAFAPLAGRTMVECVLAALRATPRIGRIAMVAPLPLPPGAASLVDVPVAERRGLAENFAAGLAALGQDAPVLAVAADIPLLTPLAITAFLDAADAINADVWYAIVSREDVAREFPGVRKTFVRLREGTFAGGSLILIRPPAFSHARPLIERAMRARKRPWELARLIGLGTLLSLAVGRLAISGVERRVARIAGIGARAVICRYPEVALDVDSAMSLAFVRARLGDRPTPAAPQAIERSRVR